MQKEFKLHQAFMNNGEKMSNCIFKSGRLSLQYYECVNKLFRSLSSQATNNVREVYCTNAMCMSK